MADSPKGYRFEVRTFKPNLETPMNVYEFNDLDYDDFCEVQAMVMEGLQGLAKKKADEKRGNKPATPGQPGRH